jgi:hypothetical protein
MTAADPFRCICPEREFLLDGRPYRVAVVGCPAHRARATAQRAGLDQVAIPGCAPWRTANPECGCNHPAKAHGSAVRPTVMGCALCACQRSLEGITQPSPYCCSAYCERCAGLRIINDDKPIRPNEWMYQQ